MSVLSIDVGVKNLAVCLLNGPEKIDFWEVFDLGNVSDSTTRRFIKLNSVLNSHPQLWDTKIIKTVLIEKQPSFNPKMRVMASALHMYFVTKGFTDIRPYSAKYKLQLCQNAGDYDCASRYQKNKKRSIDTTKHYLENIASLSCWGGVFQKAKKKDDFADSFLQGVSFYKIYKATTRVMKKPTKKTLESGKLEEAHFSWLWNLWVQEHNKVLTESERPKTGPMDAFVKSEIDTDNYTINNYLNDTLKKQPHVSTCLTQAYGDVDNFVEYFTNDADIEEE
mgnify:FL=1|tara:strand:- start:3506 stop:4342 length:837 start_codon:yes stop_codon:yes gene_type:complete